MLSHLRKSITQRIFVCVSFVDEQTGHFAKTFGRLGLREVEVNIHATQALTISEVAKKYRISYRTLRFYEERELIFPLRQGNNRLYVNTDLVRIEFILKGRQLGFTIAEIYKILSKSSYLEKYTTFVELLTEKDIHDRLKTLVARQKELAAAVAELKFTQPATEFDQQSPRNLAQARPLPDGLASDAQAGIRETLNPSMLQSSMGDAG